MPTHRISPDLEMHYELDDFTDPWRESEAILLLHGNAESSAAWFGWVPHLARYLRVVRPDMRGFGRSTAMPRGYDWTVDIILNDYLTLMRQLGIESFHLVGAKISGVIARCFAARHPENILTLTLIGAPPAYRDGMTERGPAWTHEFETQGIESWARRTMAGRLGSAFPPEGVEWWAKLMGRTPLSSEIDFIATMAVSDTRPDVPKIQCPTLVITTEGSSLASVTETRAWQQQIQRSRLLVLPGDSFHAAATDADRCALETLAFIQAAAQLHQVS